MIDELFGCFWVRLFKETANVEVPFTNEQSSNDVGTPRPLYPPTELSMEGLSRLRLPFRVKASSFQSVFL
jgi:hypothetical protein